MGVGPFPSGRLGSFQIWIANFISQENPLLIVTSCYSSFYYLRTSPTWNRFPAATFSFLLKNNLIHGGIVVKKSLSNELVFPFISNPCERTSLNHNHVVCLFYPGFFLPWRLHQGLKRPKTNPRCEGAEEVEKTSICCLIKILIKCVGIKWKIWPFFLFKCKMTNLFCLMYCTAAVLDR